MAKEAPATSVEQKSKTKLPLKTILIILGVVLLEGGTFIGVKIYYGGPKPAQGTSPIDITQEAPAKVMAEVPLATDFQVDNYTRGGRSRIMITLNVVAKVDEKNKEKLNLEVVKHKNEILSSIRVLIASTQPEDIKDPKLQVIQREIKTGLEQIVGEGLVEDILLPYWQAYEVD